MEAPSLLLLLLLLLANFITEFRAGSLLFKLMSLLATTQKSGMFVGTDACVVALKVALMSASGAKHPPPKGWTTYTGPSGPARVERQGRPDGDVPHRRETRP